MKIHKFPVGELLIITAAVFWGSMGIFVRGISAYGLSSIQIVTLRFTAAALIFSVVLLIKDPSGFRIRLRDLPLFMGLGLFSVLFLTVCYFTAIELMTLSTAAILLYTSPVWVMLMSVIFFRERLSGVKLAALALAFCGCALVSGIGGGAVNPLGLLIGIGSGIGYGLYSILGSVALRRYSPYTVTAYAFIIAGIGSWFIASPGELIAIVSGADTVSLLLLVAVSALVTAVIPYLCYTLGLKTVEASRAAILATAEPVVATLFGVIIFHEPLSAMSVAGIVLVLAAIAVLSREKTG